jgi:hypothetical protein
VTAAASWLAGGTATGYNDGVGTQAQFGVIRSVTADTTRALYVADYGSIAVRKVTTDGVVTTIAAVAAPPLAVMVGGSGVIYATEEYGQIITIISGTYRPGNIIK